MLFAKEAGLVTWWASFGVADGFRPPPYLSITRTTLAVTTASGTEMGLSLDFNCAQR